MREKQVLTLLIGSYQVKGAAQRFRCFIARSQESSIFGRWISIVIVQLIDGKYSSRQLGQLLPRHQDMMHLQLCRALKTSCVTTHFRANPRFLKKGSLFSIAGKCSVGLWMKLRTFIQSFRRFPK